QDETEDEAKQAFPKSNLHFRFWLGTEFRANAVFGVDSLQRAHRTTLNDLEEIRGLMLPVQSRDSNHHLPNVGLSLRSPSGDPLRVPIKTALVAVDKVARFR